MFLYPKGTWDFCGLPRPVLHIMNAIMKNRDSYNERIQKMDSGLKMHVFLPFCLRRAPQGQGQEFPCIELLPRSQLAGWPVDHLQFPPASQQQCSRVAQRLLSCMAKTALCSCQLRSGRHHAQAFTPSGELWGTEAVTHGRLGREEPDTDVQHTPKAAVAHLAPWDPSMPPGVSPSPANMLPETAGQLPALQFII